MSWKCWLGHKWYPLKYDNYIDISWCKKNERGVDSHKVVFSCLRCGKHKSKLFYQGGFLDDKILSFMQEKSK